MMCFIGFIVEIGLILFVVGMVYLLLQNIFFWFLDQWRHVAGKEPRVVNLLDLFGGIALSNGWLAVKTDDHQKVADTLRVKNIRECSFKSGLQGAEAYGMVFFTPPINGWVIVTGFELSEYRRFLRRLSSCFPECHAYQWHKHLLCQLKVYIDGNIVRIFEYGTTPRSPDVHLVLRNKGAVINDFEGQILNSDIDNLDFYDFMKVVDSYSIDISNIEAKGVFPDGVHGFLGRYKG